jgi:hypothetical protein
MWHHLYIILAAALVGETLGHLVPWRVLQVPERYYVFGGASGIIVLLSLEIGLAMDTTHMWQKVMYGYFSLAFPAILYMLSILVAILVIPRKFPDWKTRLLALTSVVAAISLMDVLNTWLTTGGVATMLGLIFSLFFRIAAEFKYSAEEVYWFLSCMSVASFSAFGASMLFTPYYYLFRGAVISHGSLANSYICTLLSFGSCLVIGRIHRMVRRFDKDTYKRDSAVVGDPEAIAPLLTAATAKETDALLGKSGRNSLKSSVPVSSVAV